MTEPTSPRDSVSLKLGSWLDTSVSVPSRESSEGSLRQAVLAGAQKRKQNRSRAVAASCVLGCSVVAGTLAMVGIRTWSPKEASAAIQFHVLPGNGLGQVGAYVAPAAGAPLDLKFTEGSVVELDPGARARVSATTARGATVLLETGRADVNVMHRKDAEWTIMAGPYSVRVHGTAFSVEFDPKSQLFELVMRSGVVSVEGPGISHPVEIRGAQRFVHRAGLGLDPAAKSGSEPSRGTDGVQAPASSAAMGSVSGSLGQAPVQIAAPGPIVPSVGAPASAAAPNWETKVRRGEYGDVIRDAESRGIARVLQTANSAELLALANAARFSGRVDLGRDAYKAIRQRYAGSPQSASAAFLLGRLMEPSSVAEAKRWYERYEQEAPSGALAAEAMGRKMVLAQSLGNRTEVQRFAEDYLKRFPDGPYAGVARKIVAP